MRPIDVFGWISQDPPILRYAISPSPWAAFLPNRRVYRFPFLHWAYTSEELAEDHSNESEKRSSDVFCYLVNDRETLDGLRARGIPSLLVNHNAFLDERIFRIDRRAQVYDAVYTAQMSEFKRHHLAKDIENILFIDGQVGKYDEPYLESIRSLFPNATFSHDRHPEGFTPMQVAEQLNKCRVGLCLSAREGAMYACGEYLLCGLPVVSTVSVGGRHEWFDDDFVRVVEDDPIAIAEAVRSFVRESPCPRRIRRTTLKRVWEHRRRFIDAVQGIYDSEGHADRRFVDEWAGRFFNKWADWVSISCLPKLPGRSCGENTCNGPASTPTLPVMPLPKYEYRVNLKSLLSNEEQRTLGQVVEGLPIYFSKYVADGSQWYELRGPANQNTSVKPDISVMIQGECLYVDREAGALWDDLVPLRSALEGNIQSAVQLWI